MKARSSTLWTIQQLSDEVARALAVGYAGTSNGRVRDVPDLRTIRYYTTLGLLDRPAEMRGRTALYGPRHLLQLVAIKKLQARGRSLSQIQQEMTGATDTMLRRLAGVMARPGGEATRRAASASAAQQAAVVLEVQPGADLALRPSPRQARSRTDAASDDKAAPGHRARRPCHAPAGPGAADRSGGASRDSQGRGPLDSMPEKTPVDPTNPEGRRRCPGRFPS